MQRVGIKILINMLCLSLFSSYNIAEEAWPWPDTMESTTAASESHKVLYEDDEIRILEVQVLEGEKEAMHSHKLPSVVIIDSLPDSFVDTFIDGRSRTKNTATKTKLFPIIGTKGPETPHAISNTGDALMHIYRFEFKNIEFRNIKKKKRR